MREISPAAEHVSGERNVCYGTKRSSPALDWALIILASCYLDVEVICLSTVMCAGWCHMSKVYGVMYDDDVDCSAFRSLR